MSVDLDWNQLTPLSASLVNTLNRLLSTTQRPSFIGPITINSFDFGHVPPEVDLVDIQNIYRDFLEDGDVEITTDSKESASMSPPAKEEEEDYEWVSRRGMGKAFTADTLNYHYLPPHIRYGAGPASGSVKLAEGAPVRRVLDESLSPGGYGPGVGTTTSDPNETSASFEAPESVSNADRRERKFLYGGKGEDESTRSRSSSSQREPPSPVPEPEKPLPPPAQNMGEDIQLHFKIHHESDLRINLTTSLLINYPSPLFMSLPMTLTVVGIVFNGEVVVAYEASKRRIHLCILDDQDPYGLKSSSRPAPPSAEGATSPLPPSNSYGYMSPPTTREPAGQRLLPSIFIESEIGQADKHVLRNVSRLERFIQDMIRKTLEEELVWPNFHTILLGD